MHNTKNLLRTCWIITGICIAASVVGYVYNFKNQDVSDSAEQWGQFGDYFGGILNPLLSLANLVVLTYISLSLSKIDDKRNEWTLQELARPLGQIICGDYENSIQVKLKNCGLGPLIITDILVKDLKGNISHNLAQQMPALPPDYHWDDFVIDGKNFALARDTELNIIKIENDAYDPGFMVYRKQLRERLSQLTIEVQYVDIYGRKMPSAIRNLELYRRMLTP